jgi:hypothetical protein
LPFAQAPPGAGEYFLRWQKKRNPDSANRWSKKLTVQ